MSEAKSQSFWHTVPGMLTGAAAVITAVSGLLIAMSQAGWLGRGDDDVDGAAEHQTPIQSSTQSSAPPASKAAASTAPQLVPEMQEVRLGEGVFTILAVSTEQRTASEAGLKIRVRLTNNGRYPVNFWNDIFRLSVDGVPRAPVGDLNIALPGNAADEGDVEFTFPVNAKSLVLKLRFYDETADIPLNPVAN